MRELINLIEGVAAAQTFERCQQGDTITYSDGECGYGVYAYPIRYSKEMRRYYDDGGRRTIFRLTLRSGYVIDLTQREVMLDLLSFARKRFAEMKQRMTHYIEPKVSSGSIQRFGSIIEDFVRINYPDASGYTVGHQLPGSHLPKAKQTVITRLDDFEIEIVRRGTEQA